MRDRKLGVRTRGLTQVSVPGSEDSVTLPYGDIMQILSSVGLNSTDVFVDIGCGRGRVVCCAALFRVREVIGIDHAPEMCAVAQENALRLRRRQSPIRILNASAAEYDFHEASVLYMYNPFNSMTMNRVLERIQESLDRQKRSITIIYANPVHESCLSACPWLSMVDRWEAGESGGLAVPVSFWRTEK